MANKVSRRDLLKYSFATGALATGLASRLDAGGERPQIKEFYVSPLGSDRNPGTQERPFQTLERARSAVRSLKAYSDNKLPVGGVTIWLREGRYELQETFILGPEDSGTKECRVTWAAFANERAVLSGGVAITGWRKVTETIKDLPATATGKVWVAAVPAGPVPKSRHLWRNGQHLTRARWPNPPTSTTSGKIVDEAAFRVVDGFYPAQEDLKDPTLVQRWRKELDSLWRTVEFFPEYYLDTSFSLPNDLGNGKAELFTRNDGRWATMRIPIAEVKGSKLTMAQPMGCFSYYWRGMRTMSAIRGTGYIENALSLLDQPREWYLDGEARLIYYIPEEGEDPNNAQFIASKVDKLLWIRGTTEHPVSFVEMRGLCFEHADWNMPTFGYRPVLGCYYGTQLSPLVAQAMPVPPGSVRPTDEHSEYCLQAAVDLMYARNCVLEMCRVRRNGASGIGVGEGCADNRVVGCEVSEVGGHGIHVGLAHGPLCAEDFAWARPEDEPQNNEIADCYVHHNGHLDWGSFGIFSSYAQKTRIVHNLVERQPYSGIAASFTVFAFPSGKDYEVTVERNHIHHVMEKLDDGGGLYTKDGMSPRSVIAGNLIHDIGGHNFGIYLDDKSYGPYLADNMIQAATPFYFNSTSKDQFTWGVNYTDNFPPALKQEAGIREPYKSELLAGP